MIFLGRILIHSRYLSLVDILMLTSQYLIADGDDGYVDCVCTTKMR